MSDLVNRIDAGRTDENPPPRRRYRVVLDLHADTRDELDLALTALAFSIHDDSITERTSGGYGYGYHIEAIDYGPDIDHESYERELAAWVKRDRSEGGAS